VVQSTYQTGIMTLSLLSKPLLSLFIIYITQYLMYGLCSSISNPKLFFSVKRKRKNFDLRVITQLISTLHQVKVTIDVKL